LTGKSRLSALAGQTRIAVVSGEARRSGRTRWATSVFVADADASLSLLALKVREAVVGRAQAQATFDYVQHFRKLLHIELELRLNAAQFRPVDGHEDQADADRQDRHAGRGVRRHTSCAEVAHC
jgi:hypothetical protein